MNSTLRIRIVFILFTLVCGIGIRFAGLSSHFSHIDDLGVAKTILSYQYEIPNDLTGIEKLDVFAKQWTAISRHWTYAPAQFIVTRLLLHSGQNYRQTLFWGRFPSFFFSVLSLLLWVYFYERYDRLQTPAGSLSLAILTFSWMHIIYAQQMESYAIGVFSAAALFVLFWEEIQPERHSLKFRLFGSGIAAILCHTQYQVLFFMPAYFLSLLWHDWTTGKGKRRALLYFLSSGLLFAASIYPMYALFLKRAASGTAGITWNAGPHHEFVLNLSQSSSLLSSIIQTLIFFAKNTYIVFGSVTAIISENHPAFECVRFFLFVLFVTGIASLVKTSWPRKREIGLFLAILSATWAALILKGQLAYSPTRHSLILLPAMAYLIGEGWLVWIKQLQKRFPSFAWMRWATAFVVVSLSILFLSSVKPRMAERQDPFQEEKILSLLREHDVDALIATGFTQNPALMPSVLKETNYFENETMETTYSPKAAVPFQRIAFISHRKKLTTDLFNEMKFKTQLKLMLQPETRMYTAAFGNAEDYEPVYVEEKDSQIEIDPNTRTSNGTNSFYFYILGKK